MSDKHTTQSIYLSGWYELASESEEQYHLVYHGHPDSGWLFSVKKGNPLDIMREELINLTKERDQARHLAVVFRSGLKSAKHLDSIPNDWAFSWENKTDE